MTADCGVGHNRHAVRLYFEDAAGDEDELFFVTANYLDPDSIRLDAGNERGVLRIQVPANLVK